MNILIAGQPSISRHSASRSRPWGKVASAAVAHAAVTKEPPVLDAAAAYLDCRPVAVHQAGDHVISIGEVPALGLDPADESLLYRGGEYRWVSET